jgi:LexA-binding, inner membrane-associated putative hydrolase
MFVGHLAVGFAAKWMEPRVSLGTTVFASMLPDLLWGGFMVAGIEHVEFKHAIGAGNYFAASDIALSHSLLMDAIWAALLALAYFLLRRNPRGAWLLAAAVLSHWVLDIIAHRPDMPLAPGVHKFLGLGLWTSVPLTLIVEGGMWLAAIVVYVRAISPRNRAGTYVFWLVVALLTLAWYNNIAGPPPPNPSAAGISSLVFFSLTVGWAFWMNRLRPARTKAA